MIKRNRGLIIFIATSVVLFTFLSWPVRILSMEGENGTKKNIVIKQKDTITLEYIHSIYHVRQQEIYEPLANELVLQSIYFGDMSAALYFDAYSRYFLQPQPEGDYKISGMNLHYSNISFALGHGTQYEIQVGSTQSIDLNKAFPDSAILKVRTEVISIGEVILGRLRNEN